jgi:signal transduction histidine kinase
VGVRLAPDGGYGIAGMRERAALAGGTFTVVPRAEGGTLVEAALPLDSA